MNVNKHYVALMEGLLILPAALFMASLVIRNLPASTVAVAAQRTVMWYAERQWTLWLLLVALPLVVLVIGCVTLLQGWSTEHVPSSVHKPLAAILTDNTTILIVVLTLVATMILSIVGLHILAN